MTLNLTDAGTEQGKGKGNTERVDWQALTTALGPRVTLAWERAEYGMYRADNGKGPVGQGVTIPRTGTGWATVCHHGAIRATHTGSSAESAGKARTQWCSKCAAGAPGTLPLVGHDPRTTAQHTHTTAEQAAPAAPSEAPADSKAREGMTAEKRTAIARAQR